MNEIEKMLQEVLDTEIARKQRMARERERLESRSPDEIEAQAKVNRARHQAERSAQKAKNQLAQPVTKKRFKPSPFQPPRSNLSGADVLAIQTLTKEAQPDWNKIEGKPVKGGLPTLGKKK